MSKRKGLSFDEKKATLLAAMNAEATFYTLKELETLGKSKGVIPQAVKDVVEGLCADGEVQSDKVGAQVLFWALPSQRTSALRTKKQRLDDEITQLQKEYEQLQAELASLTTQPPPTDAELADAKARAQAERRRRDQLRTQVEAFERCGPEKLAEMQKQITVAKEAANRWGDNICTVRSMFLRERRGEVSSADFNRTFELPDEFDYLE
uniref:Meiotic nuclear division protein 1 homolog n=1 Tax=Alexandrium catenella TaxID=2925 RepID=A0A7S1WJ67_ALECA|eukprot:CAMPEP_0171197560 /NCGR_PEP_ID=MMETSP0790-20130122/22475_1 /TAXON_ID=2925 /ORGANISM="Alexandrium catenella, Strain OF101" /LENGTH=207 /DNA_ID=CAMNT_0011662807 /DNA_START=58 /DNA_END=681 /DNA_ORIENTATION=+